MHDPWTKLGLTIFKHDHCKYDLYTEGLTNSSHKKVKPLDDTSKRTWVS